LKIDARQIAGFLRQPGKVKAALLYGEDEGLVRERARQLTLAVAGSLTDPFRVVELERETWNNVPAEIASMSMTGGRRVVRVRDVSDAVLEYVRAALKSPGEGFLLLEAPGLGKGKLRTFMEAAPDAACIACYPDDGKALQEVIRQQLSQDGVGVEPEALRWLADSLSPDRSVVRMETDKLALFAGAGGRVDIATVRLCVGDAAAASADEGILAAMRGDVAGADVGTARALAEGANGVALMRMAIGHLQRLHLARLRVADGMPAADAVRTLRPPVFLRSVPGFVTSLSLWSVDGLAACLEAARQVEISCKRTGSRPDLLASRFVSGLARQAAARQRGNALA
jgi:DNA polymerase-3 subunit delta